MTKAKKLKFLKVLLLKEKGYNWVAMSLDYYLVGQGETEEKAMANLCRTMDFHRTHSHEEGVAKLSELKPAPQNYWDMYEESASSHPPRAYDYGKSVVEGLSEEYYVLTEGESSPETQLA